MAQIEQLVNHQRRMVHGFEGSTYQLDTALAMDGEGLSQEIASAAAGAAEVALRLGCVRMRMTHLREYHAAYLSRYGSGSEIPILEVLSPEAGLDAPNTYAMPPRAVALPSIPEESHLGRQRWLVEMMSNALQERKSTVEITDEILDGLTVWRPEECPPRPSLDVHFSLAATSRQAIDEGRWRLILSPTAFDGLQTFGRFFDLFDEAELASLRKFAQAEEAMYPGALFVELNSTPSARSQNVGTHAPMRDYEISVNVTPSGPPHRRIPLTDVLVGATEHSFYLRSAKLGKRLIITQSHALNHYHLPNVCRALLELSTDGFAPPSLFDWGPMSNAPFLPRLARGRIVLSPAQWFVKPHSLAMPADKDSFFEAVQHWRHEWHLPQHVYLTESDNRLLLDLDHPLWVDELRRELRRTARIGGPGGVRLQEVLPDLSELWLKDANGGSYQAELVVPVRVNNSLIHADNPLPSQILKASQRRIHPGQEWTYLKLYTAVSQQDDVITNQLQELLRNLRAECMMDRWFYIRYADPHPHLRLRFHVPVHGDALSMVARCMGWAQEMINTGWASDVALSTYERELERYGGPQAINVIEELFSANSDVTVQLLKLLRTNTNLDSEAVCVFAWNALYETWGADRAPWVSPSAGTIEDATYRRFRQMRAVLCDLLTIDGLTSASSDNVTMRLGLRTILDRQHDAVALASRSIRRLIENGQLPSSEQALLGSIAHMQANRLLGLDRAREQRAHHLWQLTERAIGSQLAARGARNTHPPDAVEVWAKH